MKIKIIWQGFLKLLGFLLVSFTLTILVYALFALIFKTDTEKLLLKDIKRYEKIYPTLTPKEELIKDAIAGLQIKDNALYEKVFQTSAPDVNPMGWLDINPASDTIPDTKLFSYTRDKSDVLLTQAAEVEANFQKIFKAFDDSTFVLPPMKMPVKDLSYTQIGASIGYKINPVIKVNVWHNGLDLIVSRGTAVYCTADGVVSELDNTKESGYRVKISHDGGYSTVYSYLENNRKVRKGQRVKAGDLIGEVGIGNSLAPHLHYEVLKDGIALDPVNYLFASINPKDYANMLFMAVNTVQSMD